MKNKTRMAQIWPLFTDKTQEYLRTSTASALIRVRFSRCTAKKTASKARRVGQTLGAGCSPRKMAALRAANSAKLGTRLPAI